MDSPHLLRLGLLLLAAAAPHPNIVTSSDGSEWTQDSSSGKTTVTVYYCKDCESSICQSGLDSFEKFDKITETQSKIFSNEIIELVTSETHITMCLQQGNSFLEGIYGIVWEKASGAEFLCGILNSGAFSENGRGNINTEENKICCEAETDSWKVNPTLKWYTEPLGPKPTTAPAEIPGVGIPGSTEFLTSKTNSDAILFAFLFVGALAGMATVFYCLRLWRRQDIFPSIVQLLVKTDGLLTEKASPCLKSFYKGEHLSASSMLLLSHDVQPPAEQ